MSPGADLSIKAAIQGIALHLPDVVDKDGNVKKDYYNAIITYAAGVEIADALSHLNLSTGKGATPCPDHLAVLRDHFKDLDDEDAEAVISLNKQYQFKKQLNAAQWGKVWYIWNKNKDKVPQQEEGGK